MADILSKVVFYYGVIVFVMTAAMSWVFWRIPDDLSRAVALVFAAISVTALATIIFALTTVFGFYRTLSVWAVLGLRITIFTSLGGSAIWMWHTLKGLRRGPH